MFSLCANLANLANLENIESPGRTPSVLPADLDYHDANGLPNLLRLGVLIDTTMPATSLAGPRIALQRVLFGTLGWLGRLAGYKIAYRKYGVITAGGLEMAA